MGTLGNSKKNGVHTSVNTARLGACATVGTDVVNGVTIGLAGRGSEFTIS
jgi:hypothetical protein